MKFAIFDDLFFSFDKKCGFYDMKPKIQTMNGIYYVCTYNMHYYVRQQRNSIAKRL